MVFSMINFLPQLKVLLRKYGEDVIRLFVLLIIAIWIICKTISLLFPLKIMELESRAEFQNNADCFLILPGTVIADI